MKRSAKAAHLGRRFAGSLLAREAAPPPGVLAPAELELWMRMSKADRAHSVAVAERLLDAHPDSPRIEVAAALLHDVGKSDAGLGTFRRVIATIAPVGDRARRYRDHERLGAALLVAIGSDPTLVALVAGTTDSAARRRLEQADNV